MLAKNTTNKKKIQTTNKNKHKENKKSNKAGQEE